MTPYHANYYAHELSRTGGGGVDRIGRAFFNATVELIYVKGDHHLENLRSKDQTWKVRLTDEDFPKLMWEGC